jgi:hypothetical protein
MGVWARRDPFSLLLELFLETPLRARTVTKRSILLLLGAASIRGRRSNHIPGRTSSTFVAGGANMVA